ncbi:MAG: glycoside hydrolase family 15 protein, partial [Actinomycetota bacterium]
MTGWMVSLPRSSRRPEPTTPGARIDGYAPIAEYAAIGDGRTIALVARDGSIDWMPVPELHRTAAFDALLDAPSGGRFELHPVEPFRVARRYVPDTNVLETEFETSSGRCRVTDALNHPAPTGLPWIELARRVEGLSGTVRMTWSFRPRFDLGRAPMTMQAFGDVTMFDGDDVSVAFLTFDAGEERRSENGIDGAFDVASGESALLAMLGRRAAPISIPARDEIERRIGYTIDHWQRWTSEIEYEGPWRGDVVRSGLVLAILTLDRTSALIAAGTTSLPESIGGDANWDYRFAWMRDSTFAMEAILAVGMRQEADAWLGFLMRTLAKSPKKLEPLYTLEGETPEDEHLLDLPGYRGSTPVRLGNKAGGQLQLGTYGDLFDSVWKFVRAGGRLDPATRELLADTASQAARLWRSKDSGIWELRERTRHYTSSKIGCWTAMSRAIDLAKEGHLPDRDVTRWERARGKIREFIEARCWN